MADFTGQRVDESNHARHHGTLLFKQVGQLGRRLEVGQRRVDDADFVWLRIVGWVFVDQVGQAGPKVTGAALVDGGNVGAFVAPPADDSRRCLHSSAADAQVVVAPVTACRLDAPSTVSNFFLVRRHSRRPWRRRCASMNDARVAVGQGRTDAGALCRLQVAGAVSTRSTLITNPVSRTPATLWIGRTAQLRTVPEAAGTGAHHLRRHDVCKQITTNATVVSTEDQEDVTVSDISGQTEDALLLWIRTEIRFWRAGLALIEYVVADPRVALQMIEVQSRIVTNLLAVMLVRVATEDDQVRTHENSCMEGTFQWDVQVRQHATRVK